MTTFNTVDELLDILGNNPRLLEAVRNKILTDDLIKLPQEFRDFQKQTGVFVHSGPYVKISENHADL